MLATVTASTFAQTTFRLAGHCRRTVSAGVGIAGRTVSMPGMVSRREVRRLGGVGPQCQPEDGDWYARSLYQQGSAQNKFHVAHYARRRSSDSRTSSPVERGEFPSRRAARVLQKSGAKYFWPWPTITTTLTCIIQSISRGTPLPSAEERHHRAVGARGAKKRAAFCRGVHASHAWSWYEPAQGADKDGPLAGVPYDGKLMKRTAKDFGGWP